MTTLASSNPLADASAPAPASAQPDTPSVLAPDDLAEVIQAYSAVAERLQSSHEALQNEVVRLHDELAAKNAQLERGKRLAALGEMAAGIAHEIRNPLAAIQLYAEMVNDDLTDAAQGLTQDSVATSAAERIDCAADNSRKIADAVRGLSAIVLDVLSFARQIQPSVRECDGRELLQRVVDAHRPAIESGNVAVDLRIGTPTVTADPELLHQALLNLVRNAADAMAERGGGRLTLAVESNRVVVADTGPGLPDQVIDRIFNPFFTTRSTGTGLGLAIVHRIIDAHGGTIAVRNDPQHGGAVFTLELPEAACGLASSRDPMETAA
ncbi:MAG: ATP-binding protein [Planctomycetota bacterium]